MPRVAAWNSIKSEVCHNNTKCTTGNNIEKANRRDGDGGKRVCDECKRLNREHK
jgi:hypothetical protein